MYNQDIECMSPPSARHQRVSNYITHKLTSYIENNNGACEVYAAPFGVYLNDTDYLMPDISLVCDTSKVVDKGCIGAPDLVVEITSPATRRQDYLSKVSAYSELGVREYWIVDLQNNLVVKYEYEKDVTPAIQSMSEDISVGIFRDMLRINLGHL